MAVHTHKAYENPQKKVPTFQHAMSVACISQFTKVHSFTPKIPTGGRINMQGQWPPFGRQAVVGPIEDCRRDMPADIFLLNSHRRHPQKTTHIIRILFF